MICPDCQRECESGDRCFHCEARGGTVLVFALVMVAPIVLGILVLAVYKLIKYLLSTT